MISDVFFFFLIESVTYGPKNFTLTCSILASGAAHLCNADGNCSQKVPEGGRPRRKGACREIMLLNRADLNTFLLSLKPTSH